MMRRPTIGWILTASSMMAAAMPAPAQPLPTATRSWEILVRNPVGIARPGATVEIDGARIGMRAATGWSASIAGHPVPTQAIDRDGDGQPDALVLGLDLAPRQVLRIRLDPTSAQGSAAPSPVQAVIGVRRGATLKGQKWTGGHIEDVDRLDLDATHVAGDRLTLYDGPAWESGRVAFRIYLDQRNALDLFGKKQAAPVLQWIGRGVGDYHKEADWGMDILHVTDSLGAGGLGVIEQGHVRQVGPASGGVSGRRIANGPVMAGVAVDDLGLRTADLRYDLHARYTIAADTRITQVEAQASAGAPIVAGIEKRPDVAVLRSHTQGTWSYVATYGQQSFIGDGLGMAILYRPADTAEVGDDGHTVFVRFKNPSLIRYAVAAAWAKEGASGIDPGLVDQAHFVRFLEQELRQLDHPLLVTVTPVP